MYITVIIFIIIIIDLTAADSWLQVNAFTASQGEDKMTVQEVAMGFIRVANETMCRPIRALTQVLGILFLFGQCYANSCLVSSLINVTFTGSGNDS